MGRLSAGSWCTILPSSSVGQHTPGLWLSRSNNVKGVTRHCRRTTPRTGHASTRTQPHSPAAPPPRRACFGGTYACCRTPGRRVWTRPGCRVGWGRLLGARGHASARDHAAVRAIWLREGGFLPACCCLP